MSHKRHTFACGILPISALLAVLLLAPLRAAGAEVDKPIESIEITDLPELIKSAVARSWRALCKPVALSKPGLLLGMAVLLMVGVRPVVSALT